MNGERLKSIEEIITYISKIKTDNIIAYRGERKLYGKTSLVPFVYRNGYLNSEDRIYRESQRYNDEEFNGDNSTFDRLSRIQHYGAPTRLIDISEDLFSALFFALANKIVKGDESEDAVLYIFEIEKSKVRYYDSDSVSVISNLAKIPLDGFGHKTKKQLVESFKIYNKAKIESESLAKTIFNNEQSVKYLLHEIRDEKPQFEPVINPKHLFSVTYVLPKLTNRRLISQKGAFLLFGINPHNVEKPIKLIDENGMFDQQLGDNLIDHPIKNIHRLVIDGSSKGKMRDALNVLGIRKSFIYPEIENISKYLVEKYNQLTNGETDPAVVL